jgi:hypothetical protein
VVSFSPGKGGAEAVTSDDARGDGGTYEAMKASRCHGADRCVYDEACPFAGGCLEAEIREDDGPAAA